MAEETDCGPDDPVVEQPKENQSVRISPQAGPQILRCLLADQSVLATRPPRIGVEDLERSRHLDSLVEPRLPDPNRQER